MRRPSTAAVNAQPVRVDATIYSLVSDPFGMYAGTSQGLLRADAEGMTWTPVESLPMTETRFVAMNGGVLMVAGLKRIALSLNDGGHWSAVALPSDLTQISAIAVDEPQEPVGWRPRRRLLLCRQRRQLARDP